jgi:hypothetical protein
MYVREFSLESLNHVFEMGKFEHCSYDNIETNFEISPEDFLTYAEYDLTAKYDHHLVNSLSNTKRAIDSQLDSLLIGFGLSERLKKLNFPKKIEFLNNIGVISPRILTKINRKRNLLEHEYKNPSEEEVEDALDVAILFINYTNKYLFQAITYLSIIYEDDEGRDLNSIELDWINGELIFSFPPLGENVVIKADQTNYEQYLKFYLKACTILLR